MARLPQAQIDRIKQDISLLRLVERQGYEVTRQGKDYVVLCPFHDDKTPSCVISPKTNLFHCFGCGEAGSVIDWVMKTQGLSFRLACELLLKDIDTVATAPAKPQKYNTAKKMTSSLAADLVASDVQQSLEIVVNYYHQTLLDAPEALGYLEKRGLNDPALIKAFKLGFANRTLAYHIPEKNRQAGKQIRDQLKEIGVLRSTGHEHFNGALVVPVVDTSGNVTELYGRRISDKNQNKGAPKHLYLPGPHRGVFNHQGLVNQPELIICEALIDAMTFWVHGFKHVTSSYGTQGFTEDHLTFFKEVGVKRVLIAYDRDQSGDMAAEKLAKKLQENGIDCFRVLLPNGMDVNQFAGEAESKTEAHERLSQVIRKAEWLGNGKPPERQLSFDSLPVTASKPAVKSDAIIAELRPEDQSIELNVSPELSPLVASPSPLPQAPADEIECEIKEHEILLGIGDRVYRVRGLNRNTTEGQLKINLMATSEKGYHTDTLELYHAKQRQVFINQACLELGVKDEVIKKDLGKVLLKLESLQDEQRHAAEQKTIESHRLSPEEQEQAMALLTDKNLLDKVLADFNQLGLVGEDTNKLVGYLACVSRKLDRPLGVVIQSSSAAGKSSLMDSILQLMPEEDRVQYSAMTGQSLFYMGETNLKHKILAIAEEEGASNASYALKLLQSEGEVTIASTGKDDATGDLVTKEYRVEGPTQLFMTTTAIDVDEELMNRCLILSVDESKDQTEAIHAQQRYGETLEGVFAKATKSTLITQHQNAQRLLKPYAIVNPYADQLTFLSDKTRTRRDHMKYLTLIKTITLLHQYQREIKVYKQGDQSLEYLEVTLSDIEQANRLVHQVLGKSLGELPPQTRNLLNQIQQWVKQQCAAKKMDQSDLRFSRRDVRELTGWGNTQLKVHLRRLEELEYLLCHKGGRGQSFVYELLYDGCGDDFPHLMGLMDVKALKKCRYDEKKSGQSVKLSGVGRPQVGMESGDSRLLINPLQPSINGASPSLAAEIL